MRDTRTHPHAKDTVDEVRSWGGIVTGSLTAWADEIGCEPERVPERLHAAGEVVMDTAKRKNNNYDEPRPDDSETRHMAVIPKNGLLEE